MKKFKSFLKLPGGGEINRCYYPFKLDTYGCGCGNNCLYCYARSILNFRNLWDEENPNPADFMEIEKLLVDHFEKGKKTKFDNLLKAKIPLRLGGMTDCFSHIEKKYRNTLRLLMILWKYRYPYLILTKNTLIAENEYINALDKRLAYIQFSITTPYDDISKIYEQGAEITTERLQALKKLSDLGFCTAVRINPLFPMYKDGHFSRNIQSKKFKYFEWDLIRKCIEAGAKTIIAGFVRLSSWNIKWIKEKTGEDLTWLFDKNIKEKNQALHFSTEEKRYYYEKMKKECEKWGAEFSVCYDGDDDYNEFRYLWANKNDCCNGLGKIPGFKNNFYIYKEKYEGGE
jgi:DNA repair photolyase